MPMRRRPSRYHSRYRTGRSRPADAGQPPSPAAGSAIGAGNWWPAALLPDQQGVGVVLGKEAHTLAGRQIDRSGKAIEHVSPAVDRRAAGAVLVEQVLDQVDTKPLDQAEASPRFGRDDLDRPPLRGRRRTLQVESEHLEIIGDRFVREAADVEAELARGQVIEWG